MPFNVKFQAFFGTDLGYGWTETHWRVSQASQAPDLELQLQNFEANILPPRQYMLAGSGRIIGTRASTKVTGGIASKAHKMFLLGAPGQNMASQNDSAAIVMYDTTNTRKKVIHMRGLWSLVVQNEAFHPEADPTGIYKTCLGQYQGNLVAQTYGWMGRNPITTTFGTVNGYTINMDGTVTFAVAISQGSQPVPTTTDPYSVRFSKLNNSKSTLNKTIVCVSPNGTISTVAPIATGPFVAKGRFYINPPAFIAYGGAGPSSLGERRMGKYLGLYPGKSARKARY